MRFIRRCPLAASLLAAFAAAPLAAQGVGTTGAQVMQLPAGARAAALSGAYTAASGDADVLFYNPAGNCMTWAPVVPTPCAANGAAATAARSEAASMPPQMERMVQSSPPPEGRAMMSLSRITWSPTSKTIR
jgi:hypothetical protein